MSNLWITADTHFGHENIIKYCNRPFKSVEQMDKVLIHNWNERVKPLDHIIINGDFMFHNSSGGKKGEGVGERPDYYINQLNGIKTFIRGNHEKSNFPSVRIKGLEISLSNKTIWVTHSQQNLRLEYDINLVGHSHIAFKIKKMNNGYNDVYIINIGVDQWKFYPVRVIDILSFLDRIINKKEELQ
jgi:calcineurin-like phosphoesterase family protein